jgi:cell pole-organizing protein PopZ
MAQAAKAQEPSMEEILASIRRIIADDEGKPAPRASEPPKPAAPRPATPPAAPRAPPPPKPAASPPPPPAAVANEIDALIAAAEPHNGAAAADILDLTESMATPSGPAVVPGFRTIDAQPDVVFSDPPMTPAPPDHGIDGSYESPARGRETLLSGDAAAAVDSAFSSLAQTVLVQNARTLEDLVREMLRPMLKSWLDDNLPGLVERLVRSEIERVSRGRS